MITFYKGNPTHTHNYHTIYIYIHILCILSFNPLPPQKMDRSVCVTFLMTPIYTCVTTNWRQWANGSPINVTDFGRVILANEAQPSKAPTPMWRSAWHPRTCCKEIQPEKALKAMEFTDSGMLMFTKELQPSKAATPMEVIDLGRVTCFNELQCTKVQPASCVIDAGRAMFTKELQLSKARVPM